jgi:hypothetical protein
MAFTKWVNIIQKNSLPIRKLAIPVRVKRLTGKATFEAGRCIMVAFQRVMLNTTRGSLVEMIKTTRMIKQVFSQATALQRNSRIPKNIFRQILRIHVTMHQ